MGQIKNLGIGAETGGLTPEEDLMYTALTRVFARKFGPENTEIAASGVLKGLKERGFFKHSKNNTNS